MTRTCREEANHCAARRNGAVLDGKKPASVRSVRRHARMEQGLHWRGDREAVRAVCQEERGGRPVILQDNKTLAVVGCFYLAVFAGPVLLSVLGIGFALGRWAAP